MNALVIGGSGSIGSAIVERLLEEGYHVIVHYCNKDIETLKERYLDKDVSFLKADLSKAIDLDETFQHINQLDCLIYCSGRSVYGMLQDMTDSQIDESYHLNVRQLIRCCRYFIDTLRQSENGRVVVISSIWGETGASMETVYSSMKSAQIGFVKALSQELSLTSITVNAITPGFVSGNMSDEWTQEEKDQIINDLPQKRMVDPKEVAHCCAYLCHPLAKSVTGSIQKVNGGWYL